MPDLPAGAADVLSYWLGHGEKHSPADIIASRGKMWFQKSEEVDEEIRERFGDSVRAAHAEALDAWAATPYGRLALIILIDQFSRNIHRDSPVAFAADPIARRHTRELLRAGEHQSFRVHERLFAYLPLEHSEDVADQRRCVALFEAMVEELDDETNAAERKAAETYLGYARSHCAIIETYKRFPHRNKVLGRPNRPGEEDAKGF